jgi:hypothetical protein
VEFVELNAGEILSGKAETEGFERFSPYYGCRTVSQVFPYRLGETIHAALLRQLISAN